MTKKLSSIKLKKTKKPFIRKLKTKKIRQGGRAAQTITVQPFFENVSALKPTLKSTLNLTKKSSPPPLPQSLALTQRSQPLPTPAPLPTSAPSTLIPVPSTGSLSSTAPSSTPIAPASVPPPLSKPSSPASSAPSITSIAQQPAPASAAPSITSIAPAPEPASASIAPIASIAQEPVLAPAPALIAPALIAPAPIAPPSKTPKILNASKKKKSWFNKSKIFKPKSRRIMKEIPVKFTGTEKQIPVKFTETESVSPNFLDYKTKPKPKTRFFSRKRKSSTLIPSNLKVKIQTNTPKKIQLPTFFSRKIKTKSSIQPVTKTSRSPISPISSKLTPQAILYTEYIKNIINNEQINIGLELLNNTKLTIYRKTKLYNLLIINNIKKEQLKYVSEPDPFFWSRICKIFRDMKFITSDNSTCTIGEFMDDNWSNNEASYIYDKYNEIEIKPGVKIKNSVDNIKAIKTVLTNMMNNPYQTINNFLTKEIAPNQINTLFSEYIQEIYGFNKSKLQLQPSNLMRGGNNNDVVLFIDAYQNPKSEYTQQTVCLFYGNYEKKDLMNCNHYKTVIDNCLNDLNKCIKALQKREITNIFELIDYFIDSINGDIQNSETTNELLDFIIECLYGIKKTDYVKSISETDIRMLTPDLYNRHKNLVKKMFSIKEPQKPLKYFKTFNEIIAEYIVMEESTNTKDFADILPKQNNGVDASTREVLDANNLLKAFYELIEIKEHVKCLITDYDKSDNSDNFDKKNAINYIMKEMPRIKENYNKTIQTFIRQFRSTFEELKEQKNETLEELPMYKWIASLFDSKQDFGSKFINYIILYYKNRLEKISDKQNFDIILTGTCYVLKYEKQKYKLDFSFPASIVYDYKNKDIKGMTCNKPNLKIFKTYISILHFLLDNKSYKASEKFLNLIKPFKKDVKDEIGYQMNYQMKSTTESIIQELADNKISEYKNLVIKLLTKQDNKSRINHNILEQSKIGELLYTITLISNKIPATDSDDKKIFDTITTYLKIIINNNIRLRKQKFDSHMSSNLDIFNIQAMEQQPDPSIQIKYNKKPQNKNIILIKLLQELNVVPKDHPLNLCFQKITATESVETEFNKYIKIQYPTLCNTLNDKWFINTDIKLDNIDFATFVDDSFQSLDKLIINIKNAKNIHKNDIIIKVKQELEVIEIKSCKKILTDFLNNLTRKNEELKTSLEKNTYLTNFSTFLNNFEINFMDDDNVLSNTVLFKNDDTIKSSLISNMNEAKQKQITYDLNQLQSDLSSYIKTLVHEQSLMHFSQDEDLDDTLQGGIITLGMSAAVAAATIVPPSLSPSAYVLFVPQEVTESVDIGLASKVKGAIGDAAAWGAAEAASRIKDGATLVLNKAVEQAPLLAVGVGVGAGALYFSKGLDFIQKLNQAFSFGKNVANVGMLPITSRVKSVGRLTRKNPGTTTVVLGVLTTGALLYAGRNWSVAYSNLNDKQLQLSLSIEQSESAGSNNSSARKALEKARNEVKDATYDSAIQMSHFYDVLKAIGFTAVGLGAKTLYKQRKKDRTTSTSTEEVIQLVKQSAELKKKKPRKHNSYTIHEVLNSLIVKLLEVQSLQANEIIKTILSENNSVEKDKTIRRVDILDIETEFRTNIELLKADEAVDILLINSIFNILNNHKQHSFLYYIWIKAHHIYTNTKHSSSDSSSEMDQCEEYKKSHLIQKSSNNSEYSEEYSNYTKTFKNIFKKHDDLIELFSEFPAPDSGRQISDEAANDLITRINDTLSAESEDQASEGGNNTKGGLSSGERILKQGKHKLSRRKIAIHYKGSIGASRQKNTKRKSKIKLNNKTKKQRKIHYRTQKQKKINNKTRKQRKKNNSRKQKKIIKRNKNN